jgi:hypothetical protein
MNSSELFGDPLLESLLDLAGYTEKKETVSVVDLRKQRALSDAYDMLVAMQRSAGMSEQVDVNYHCSAGCASVSAEIPGLYLNAPFLLALVLAEASNMQMFPTPEGKIRVVIYFGDYFKEVG